MTVGPLTIPVLLLQLAAALGVLFLFDRLIVRKRSPETSGLMGNLIIDGILIILVVTKLYPALEDPGLIFRDPAAFLYRPAGPAAVIAGAAVFLIYAIIKILRKRPLPDRFFSLAGLETAVFAAAVLIALLLPPLFINTSPESAVLADTNEQQDSTPDSAAYTEDDEPESLTPRQRFESLQLQAVHPDLLNYRQQTSINWQADFLLVNLWATWCPPCRGEIPELNSFYKETPRERIELIAVNLTHTESSKQKVLDFIREQEIGFPVLLDPEGIIGTVIKAESIPTTVVFGPGGDVRIFRQGVVSRSWLEKHTD